MRVVVAGTVLIVASGACTDIAAGQYRGVSEGRSFTVTKIAGNSTLGIEIASDGDVFETDFDYSVTPDCYLNVGGLGELYGKVRYDDHKSAILIGDTFALRRV